MQVIRTLLTQKTLKPVRLSLSDTKTRQHTNVGIVQCIAPQGEFRTVLRIRLKPRDRHAHLAVSD